MLKDTSVAPEGKFDSNENGRHRSSGKECHSVDPLTSTITIKYSRFSKPTHCFTIENEQRRVSRANPLFSVPYFSQIVTAIFFLDLGTFQHNLSSVISANGQTSALHISFPQNKSYF